MKIYKWGIIGPGKIANKFAKALSRVPNSELIAVASRDKERAELFGREHQVKKYYDNYEAIATDSEIDIVYIATPHTFHHRQVLLCLTNKKAVLCEKPLSVNYPSSLELVNMARSNNVFLMEAMWTRFLPVIKETIRLIDNDEIGKLKFVKADFGFSSAFNADSRIYDLKLGGGSLLDIGVYPLFLALLLLGEPDSIKAVAKLAATGADEEMNAILYYKDEARASLSSTVAATTPIVAEITGTKGSITIQSPWYKSSSLVLIKDNIEKQISLPFGDYGFEFEIEEVTKCLDQNLTESPLLPLNFSLLLSKVINEISDQCNLRYKVQ
ncbi:MAG: Gfo/Idh/MocA family oxidoreductase [Chitinophagaceae bacterium]